MFNEKNKLFYKIDFLLSLKHIFSKNNKIFSKKYFDLVKRFFYLKKKRFLFKRNTLFLDNLHFNLKLILFLV